MAKAMIVTALGGRPLRVVQSALSPAGMWNRLTFRHARSSTANKRDVLISLMNKRYGFGEDIGNYLAELETSVHKLSSMGLPVAEVSGSFDGLIDE